MAESSLSIGVANLRQEVGAFLGYGGTSGNWSAAQLSEINRIVSSGVRRVYYPPAMDSETLAYEWSWLRPTSTLAITNVIAVSGSDGVNAGTSLDAASVTDWTTKGIDTAAHSAVITKLTGTVVSGTYAISSVAAGNLTLATSAGTGTCTYSIERAANWNLPDNFGRLIGVINYAPNEYRLPISLVSVGKLLAMRAYSTTSSAPSWAAIRYKSSTGASGQRQEILFYPDPDSAYTLYYEYEAYAGELTDSFPYPLGGMQMAEVYIESCLAVAESRINDEIGQHTIQFKSLLQDAIARDKKRGARYYGAMGNAESIDQKFHRGWTGETYSISYKNQSI